MKIGFFTQNVSKGGLDTFIINLLSNWPIDTEIVLFCNKSHPGLDDLKKILSNKVTVIDYQFLIAQDIDKSFSNDPKIIKFLVKSIYWLIGYPYLILMIRSLLRNHNFQRFMVINGGYPGGDACLAATIAWASLSNSHSKAWHNFHNLVLPYSSNPWRRIKERLIDHMIILSSEGLVTVSEASLNSLNIRPKLVTCKSCFIHNGIQLMDTNNGFTLRRDLGLGESTQIVLMLATYEPRKGHAFLFEAMKVVIGKNSNVYLLVCGYGSTEEFKKVLQLQKDSSLSSKTILQGHQEISSNLLAQVDVLVIPSQFQESFGFTAVEAMSCGLPVVCTDVGGLPEVVEHGVTGFVVERTNSVKFGLAINSLLSDPERRQKMGEAGRLRVQKLFTAKRMTEQYVQLIQQ